MQTFRGKLVLGGFAMKLMKQLKKPKSDIHEEEHAEEY